MTGGLEISGDGEKGDSRVAAKAIKLRGIRLGETFSQDGRNALDSRSSVFCKEQGKCMYQGTKLRTLSVRSLSKGLATG